MSKKQLKEIYNQKSREIVGKLPSDAEVEELYQDYLALVDFMKSEGSLRFEKNNEGKLDVFFHPIKSNKPPN